ncbi:MAG: SPASM domain-containing protein [Leptolyngbyaceae bacterium]|nr:SPASM domain-containing protein [Leptolyngbyaceae bacterium]
MTRINQKIDSLQISEKTKENVIRKSDFVDHVQLFPDGVPMFSWIDISLTELCNRVCVFCPRADSDLYPNQNLNISLVLINKIATELKAVRFGGGVVFCGYGEPLLHPEILEIVRVFGPDVRTEIVTNGDKLTPSLIRQLFGAGLSFLCISMYDGPEQVEFFKGMLAEADVPSDKFILRDRWHSEQDSFGLKLTNRAGVVKYGPSVMTNHLRPCHYPSYSLTIDWNGDVLLCVQDWQKKVKFGNLNNMSLESVWRSSKLSSARDRLIEGKRTAAPCKECNADGTLHGFNHVNAWELSRGSS